MSGSRRGDAPVLVVDIVSLLRTPAVRRPYRATVVLDGLANSDVVVTGPVEVDLVLEAVGSDIVVTGRLSARWTGDCRRCLEAVPGRLDVEVSEVFEPDPTEGETYPRGAEEIVLDDMVREAVVLALPVAPLCREECRGPDPDRYPARPVSDLETSPRDPRWAVLDDLDLGDDEGGGSRG